MPFYCSPARAKTPLPSHERPEGRFGICLEEDRVREAVRFNRVFPQKFMGKTHLVAVNEAAAISRADRLPCVGTISLYSCLGLAVHDPQAKVGGAAHLYLDRSKADMEAVGPMLDLLLHLSDAKGGGVYHVYAFNCINGVRTWSEDLTGHLNSLMFGMIESGKASGFSHRDERNFILDVRDGSLFTGRTH
ncbi:MAG: hypothetical protein V1827_03905 [Candidatus Micrarchaeota archaeon]